MRRTGYGDVPSAQLATRIPKALHRRLKLYCTEAEMPLQDFVAAALRERLARLAGRKRDAGSD
jgi:predicted HicB family RNase H-like nuclease